MKINKGAKLYSFLTTHFLSILLVVFYITEGYSKYIMFYYNERTDLTKLIKLGVMLFILWSVIKNYKLIVQIFVLSGCFILGQLFINPNFDYTVVGAFFKYLFPILLFSFFNKNKLSLQATKGLQVFFEGIIIFNSILILLGYIFETQLFSTYESSRFGYNGLFITSATGTYVYLISIFYFLFKYKKAFVFSVKAMFVLLIGLLVGTKSLYLTIGVISIYYFVLYTQNKVRLLGVTISLLFIALGAYYALFKWDIFNSIWRNEGLLTSILSYRDKLLTERTIPFIKNNWTVVNYFFGGINSISTRSQMGFVDVFYFFGVAGGVIYLRSYVINFIKFKINRESLLFLLLLCVVIFISGNFFLNASVVVYMLIVRESIINCNQDSIPESK